MSPKLCCLFNETAHYPLKIHVYILEVMNATSIESQPVLVPPSPSPAKTSNVETSPPA